MREDFSILPNLSNSLTSLISIRLHVSLFNFSRASSGDMVLISFKASATKVDADFIVINVYYTKLKILLYKSNKGYYMKAPNFKLSSTSGKTVELSKVKSKFIIIYFYPKDNTSGCTIETNDFNKLLSKFEKLGCTIFGISKDSLESHEKWSKKLNLKFELLADEDKTSLKAYKAWSKKKFMGREFMGTVRSTFIIEKNKIIKEWRNVKAAGHAAEVLDFIKNY